MNQESNQRLVPRACNHSLRNAVIFDKNHHLLGEIPGAFKQEVLTPDALKCITQQYGKDITIVVGKYTLDNLNLGS